MKRINLGGDRLGSGNKLKVDLHGFERSTHDMGYVWRNTQAPGTLVPFMVTLALPGDNFDINLGADVKTHPTVGPLFGSFKLQLDVFECPIRLYHAWLHNNKLNIGNDISVVKLPQLEMECNPLNFDTNNFLYYSLENQQINQSSLLAYLGLRGIGKGTYGNMDEIHKNAIPFLAYWDIYKNYYANKQEEIGNMIHTRNLNPEIPSVSMSSNAGSQTYNGEPYNMSIPLVNARIYTFTFNYYGPVEPEEFILSIFNSDTALFTEFTPVAITSATPILGGWAVECSWTSDNNVDYLMGIAISGSEGDKLLNDAVKTLRIDTFDLSNIDYMREEILASAGNSNAFMITSSSVAPYGNPFKELNSIYSSGQMASACVQEGLALKTYQSDIFNNWLNTEWVDGAGGINEITAVSTSEGSFDINTLNLAQKVYDMLNRIAVSGGSYEDWLEAVYDHDPYRKCESPMYHGGLSKEIIFQEVISNAASNADGTQPLGTLGGQGKMSSKHKGGQVNIKVNEPSYILGIVSITPRIDYCQGNEFFTTHTTLNDLHKPSLDEIGFQDLVTDKMAFWDSTYDGSDFVFKSAGKQPAWLDYMTNYNRLYGNFADVNNEMFMTLARRYEADEQGDIADLTTYIDPTKFNYAFAQTDLSAMNFWVQIGVDMIARRKMSSKIMPNL